VAKRPKFPPPGRSPTDLKARIQRAEAEGRYQQALELAKNLFKQDPTPAHKELFKKMTLARARQLRNLGHGRDAQTVLENAVNLDPGREWQEQVAEELAACGQVLRALELLRRFPDSPAMPRVLAQAVDAAVSKGKSGRDLLPEVLRAQFDAVVQAFAQAEAGQDEACRTTLQAIGLQSPFLEWKVLLRGLLAYYQGDDVRALENWQRLNADRLPARLAAPLRFTIDGPYRTAQPPATQGRLQQQADRLQNSGLVPSLRALQSTLGQEGKLHQAFRQVESFLPALRQQAPHLVPRLAASFYWAIINVGGPEDIPRYQRVFPPPADDPKFSRLHALAYEHWQNLSEAHQCWREYEKEVAVNSQVWPGDQAQRVRALIWHHMGINAASIPDKKEMEELPAFLRNHPDRPQPLEPSAEKCFEHSLELAPEQLETYEALFQLWQRKKKPAEAVKVGRRLLERFPEHVPTLEAMGDLRLKQQAFAEGLEFFQRALQANPLEKRLRDRVSHAHLLNARNHAEKGHFEEARAEYRAALALEEGKKSPTVLCKWAACEFKAGSPEQAEDLLRQALEDPAKRLEVAFSMLIEAIRLKLPRPLKNRFDKDFKEGLAEPPTGKAAAAVASLAATHHVAGVKYVGQKTHQKKVIAYLDRAADADITETELESICTSLAAIGAPKVELKYMRLGQRKFAHNPTFFLAEAERNIDLGPGRCPPWPTQELLKKAQDLANALPRDKRQQELLDKVHELSQRLAALNPFSRIMSMGPMGDIFEEMFGYGDDDDDDDDYEDDWGY
jgi:tetratricopeptide (TPR) repeat protein